MLNANASNFKKTKILEVKFDAIYFKKYGIVLSVLF